MKYIYICKCLQTLPYKEEMYHEWKSSSVILLVHEYNSPLSLLSYNCGSNMAGLNKLFDWCLMKNLEAD